MGIINHHMHINHTLIPNNSIKHRMEFMIPTSNRKPVYEGYIGKKSKNIKEIFQPLWIYHTDKVRSTHLDITTPIEPHCNRKIKII